MLLSKQKQGIGPIGPIGPPGGRAAGRPGGRRAHGPGRLQQLQDFQQTTRLPTDDKSPWALIVHKATTRRRIKLKQRPKATFSKDKSSTRLQEFHQTTRVPSDYKTFNRRQQFQLIPGFLDSCCTIPESHLMYHTWITPDVPYMNHT